MKASGDRVPSEKFLWAVRPWLHHVRGQSGSICFKASWGWMEGGGKGHRRFTLISLVLLASFEHTRLLSKL